jgi:hypothetical protein
MPAKSQQQQKLFGLALAVKRGEVPRSEASDEVLDIVDSMSEKKIRDFAKTKHSELPVKIENYIMKVEDYIRGIVREIMIDDTISELSINENFIQFLFESNELLNADKELRHFVATTDTRDKKQNVDMLTKILKKFVKSFSDVEQTFSNLIKNALPKKGTSNRDFTFVHQIKSINSIIDKTLVRGKDIMRLGDLVRGAILFKNKGDMDVWNKDFQRKYSRFITDYEFKSKGSDKTYGYYGSHHYDLKIDGLTVELQVMPVKLWKYKEAAHGIYDKWRSSPTPVPEIEKALSRHLFRKGNESFVREDVSLEEAISSYFDYLAIK